MCIKCTRKVNNAGFCQTRKTLSARHILYTTWPSCCQCVTPHWTTVGLVWDATTKNVVTGLVSKLDSCQNQVQFQNLAKDKASKESVHITRTLFTMLLTMSADSTPADLESSVIVSLHVLCQLFMLQLCWSKITTGRHM